MNDVKEVINEQVNCDVDVISKNKIIPECSFDEDYFIEQKAESHRKFYRDSAFFLRWGTVINDPEFLDAINDLFDELSISGNLIGRKKLALNCVVSNLLLAHNRRYPVPVIVSRKKKFYSNKSVRYTPRFFTYNNLLPVIDSLIEKGYVLYHRGSNNSFHGVASRIEASQKFLDLFTDYRNFIDEEVEDETADIIQLKDSKTRKKRAQLIDYEDTKETNLMRERLENYNGFIQEQSFTLQIPEDDFRKLTLTKLISLYNSLISVGGYIRYSPKQSIYLSEELREIVECYIPYTSTFSFNNLKSKRVFNNGVFVKGGRIYTNKIQNIPSEIRKLIKINNEVCVEPDFSAFHIRMIYHKLGIDWPKDEDPYEFGKKGTRPLNKLAVNIMLNSSNENFAIHAISTEFKKDDALLKKFGNKITSYTYIKKLAKACKELHHQVNDSFFSGIGLDLQYEDSCMMMDILEELMNQGIPAISVHDSVMVGESHKELVLKLMHDKYVERYGFEPKIK